ncbi:MAG: hypothetical protein R3D27_04590 [Hyphomicrobiaceae bacterium]
MVSMAYRGGDLELRVPHGLSGREGAFQAEPGWLARALDSAESRAGDAGATVWVSPPVLSAVNRAYDLAVAHRAREVRLEHLVHALTLIDETALTLERHGIRVATLRRESAAVIAEQRPDGPVNGRAEPFTSQELIDTLRLAAESAYQRRSPTTTEDILAVLFDMKRETTSRTLLARHRSDWNLNVPAEPRERVRVSAGSQIIGDVGTRGEAASVTDAFQNNRLDALERAVRELAQDIGGERRVLADLLGELQRGSGRSEPAQPAPRATTLDRLSALEQAILENRAPKAQPVAAEGGASAELGDRLSRIERNVEMKFAELARTWALLGERLQGIEELMLEDRPAASFDVPQTLSRRLDALDGLEGKLKALEQSVALVLDQFGGLERRLEEAGRVDVDLTPVSARLGEIEHLLKSERGGTVDFGPIEHRLAGIERVVGAGSGAIVDLSPLDGRLKDIENRASDTALYVEGVSERLDVIEGHIDAQRAGLAQTSATIGSELKALAATITSQRATSERLEAIIGDRIQSLLGGMERQRSDLAASVSRTVAQSVEQSIVRASTAESETRARDLVHVSGQIKALADQIAGFDQRSEDPRVGQLLHLVAAQAGHIHELQQALVTVNANQQTIASSLDQWRSENAGDLGIIANRLQLIETTSRRPAEMLTRMSSEIGTISQALARREERKSRFKMWLFGTEDWVGAGWRTPDRTT